MKKEKTELFENRQTGITLEINYVLYVFKAGYTLDEFFLREPAF